MAKWTVRAIQVGSIDLDRSAMTHFKEKVNVLQFRSGVQGRQMEYIR